MPLAFTPSGVSAWEVTQTYTTTTTTTQGDLMHANAYAVWWTIDGSHLWPLAWKDNRPSRTRERIERLLGDDPQHLGIFDNEESARQYVEHLHRVLA